MAGRAAHEERAWSTVVTLLIIVVILSTMATIIVVTQRQAHDRITTVFVSRGATSAGFVSSFVSELAGRERQAAQRYLSDPEVNEETFDVVVGSFGSTAAVRLDSSGRVLAVEPDDPSLVGTVIASRYAHLSKAEAGRVAVSGVVRSAAQGTPVVAIAVPYQTSTGRQIFSPAYAVSSTPLVAFVDHVTPYKVHQVVLADAQGHVIVASPATSSTTLRSIAPLLGAAVADHPSQSTVGTDGDNTFSVAPVAGTPWLLVTSVPTSTLYTVTGGWTSLVPWVIFVFVVLLSGIIAVLQRRQVQANRSLRELAEAMSRSALRDELTGLYNRRYLLEHLERIAADAARSGRTYAVLMIDLDRFKEINDNRGHYAGDEVLRAMAGCLRQSARPGDVYGRWAGDEFIVVLPTVGTDSPRAVADRIGALVSKAVVTEDGDEVRFGVSIGCAEGRDEDFDHLVRRADRALYQAKELGRGQVVEVRATGEVVAGQ